MCVPVPVHVKGLPPPDCLLFHFCEKFSALRDFLIPLKLFAILEAVDSVKTLFLHFSEKYKSIFIKLEILFYFIDLFVELIFTFFIFFIILGKQSSKCVCGMV